MRSADHPTTDPRSAGARLSVAPAGNIGPGLSRELASAALLDLRVERPLAYASPPRDVYLLTVFCDDALTCRAEDETHSPQMVLSLLRSRPAQFAVAGAGQMVVALITPLGFLKAFGVPLRGMTDQRVDLRNLVGPTDAAALRDRVMLSAGAARAEALARWIEDRVARRRHLEASAWRVAEAAMGTHAPESPLAVDALARGVGLQRRQLERDFRYWLGMSPGAYAKLIRFQRAATDIHAGSEIAAVSYAQGYADQPHLTRVLRRMSSATPREIGRQGRDTQQRQLREAFAERLLVVAQDGQAG